MSNMDEQKRYDNVCKIISVTSLKEIAIEIQESKDNRKV